MERTKTRKQLAGQKAKLEHTLEEFILNAIGKRLTKVEQNIYEKKKFELEKQIEALDRNLREIDAKDKAQVFDYEKFSNFLTNAAENWKKLIQSKNIKLPEFYFRT